MLSPIPRTLHLLFIRAAPRLRFGTRKGQGERGGDSWAYRLGVLGAAAATIKRETVGDNYLPPVPVAAASAGAPPPPTGDRRDDNGASVGVGGAGQRRAYHVAARTKNKVVAPGRKCCESRLARLGGEVSRQLESVSAGERRLNGCVDGGGRGGGRMARFREEVLSLRAEEAAVLTEIAERRNRVAALTDELCDVEDAVQEVGGEGRNYWRQREGEEATGSLLSRCFCLPAVLTASNRNLKPVPCLVSSLSNNLWFSFEGLRIRVVVVATPIHPPSPRRVPSRKGGTVNGLTTKFQGEATTSPASMPPPRPLSTSPPYGYDMECEAVFT